MRPRLPAAEPEAEPGAGSSGRGGAGTERARTDPRRRRNRSRCLGFPHRITAFQTGTCEQPFTLGREERSVPCRHCVLSPGATGMWRASAGHAVTIAQDDGGADDWETDPDFVNDVSEKEQRWGAKTVQGSGHQEHINIHKLRENVFQEHQSLKEKELETGPKASHGYGGKFGVEQDRMDKASVMFTEEHGLVLCVESLPVRPGESTP